MRPQAPRSSLARRLLPPQPQRAPAGGGWGDAFLQKNKAASEKVTAAAQQAIDKAAGKASSSAGDPPF